MKKKTRSTLLTEAVADAEMIRDTAIANARQQLAEMFEPQLKNMLSAKLRNEIEDLGEDDVNEQNTLDSSNIGSSGFDMEPKAATKPSKSASDSSAIENPDQEHTDFDDPNPKVKSVNEDAFGDDDEEDMMAGAAPAPEGGADMGAAPMGGAANIGGAGQMDLGADDMGMGGDDMGGVDELDLEAIIRELEADVAGAAGAAPAVQPEGFNQAQAGVDPRGANTIGATFETIDHGTPAKGVETDGKSPTPKDGVNGGKEVKPGQEVAEHPMMEELDLDEILREVEADEEKPWNKKGDDSEKIATENVDLKRQLREHRDCIVFLKGKINESNMLNAKLLFTNKLFRSFELNGKQKLQIVETFDRATTQREVKLIYTTLAESLNGNVSGKSVKKQNTVAITEGLASKPVGSTKPVATQALNENAEAELSLRNRMQKLAGIRIL